MPSAETPKMKPAEATFTLKRAAEVAGVSPSTLRRHKDLLRQHGATITDHGWKVPMSTLIASGLMRRTTPPDATQKTPAPTTTSTSTQSQERVQELETEALELRHRAELAEERQRSAEQQARDARALAAALEESLKVERRMLTAAIPQPASTTSSRQTEVSEAVVEENPRPENSAPARTEEKPHSSWWRRLWG